MRNRGIQETAVLTLIWLYLQPLNQYNLHKKFFFVGQVQYQSEETSKVILSCSIEFEVLFLLVCNAVPTGTPRPGTEKHRKSFEILLKLHLCIFYSVYFCT